LVDTNANARRVGEKKEKKRRGEEERRERERMRESVKGKN